jgi:Sep-tRNA:Cys-tRNA synthetase
LEYRYKDTIIINPLMRGGIVPRDVQEKLFREGWTEVGYTLCFDCIEGRSSLITKPPIKRHLEELAKFFGGDVAEHTFGCRAAQYAVMKAAREAAEERKLKKTVIADPNSHYSTNIAAEMAGLEVVEPPHTGYPEYRVTLEAYEEKINAVGEPALVMATHADPYYGNISPVKELGELCYEREIPYMVNAAYTGGVMPVNIKDLKADFLTLSAHKSMASIAPLGYLVTTYEWSKRVFAVSRAAPDWTGRGFGKKIPGLFGCSVGGLPLASSIMSFPMVKERVKEWPYWEKKINDFIDRLEEIDDLMLLGERPHRHHLLHFETPVFWEISKHHKRRGFFLAEEMFKRGIVGLHKGLSKHVKLSIYGLGDQEIEKVVAAFEEIAAMNK